MFATVETSNARGDAAGKDAIASPQRVSDFSIPERANRYVPVTQWLCTAALVAFIGLAIYGKLDWSPVLIPSAIFIWYGAIRAADQRGGQE